MPREPFYWSAEHPALLDTSGIYHRVDCPRLTDHDRAAGELLAADEQRPWVNAPRSCDRCHPYLVNHLGRN